MFSLDTIQGGEVLGQKVQTGCLLLFDLAPEWQHNADGGAVLVGGMEAWQQCHSKHGRQSLM